MGGAGLLGGRRPILRQAQDDLLGGAGRLGGRAVGAWCIIAYLELARGAGG